jgi:hypothetical protein
MTRSVEITSEITSGLPVIGQEGREARQRLLPQPGSPAQDGRRRQAAKRIQLAEVVALS